MSTIENFLDSSVPSNGMDTEDFAGIDSLGATGDERLSYSEPGYEGKIDYRIRQLSYSSLLTLHSCPRKFQLYKLRSTGAGETDLKSSITFAFGHAVGTAIQQTFEGLPPEQVIWNMFLSWETDLLAVDEKANKSFWAAVIALKKFISLRESGVLKDYDLVSFNGRPATELSFCVNFPDGFRLRGHVDAVLEHRETKEVIVLEIKTTGATVNAAIFKNSAQAIGYSIVLDVIFPELSSYKVLYFVYQTKQGEYTPIPFTKTYLQRALWIRELLLDIELIKLYEDAEIYPMHGETCFNFYRECEYINTCTLNTDSMTKPCTEEQVDTTEYQINLTLNDLLDAQFRKIGHTE
jgi:hypothetical protein